MCIQQTVLDLLQSGYQVHIIADAVSSRNQMDRKYAFKVMPLIISYYLYMLFKYYFHLLLVMKICQI